MKIFVVALLVIAVTVRAELSELSSVEKSFNACLAENDIKPGEVAELEKKKDPKFRCIAACVYEKEEFMKNGELNKDAIAKATLEQSTKISEADVKKIIESCVAKVKDVTDICDLSTDFGACMGSELSKAGIHIA